METFRRYNHNTIIDRSYVKVGAKVVFVVPSYVKTVVETLTIGTIINEANYTKVEFENSDWYCSFDTKTGQSFSGSNMYPDMETYEKELSFDNTIAGIVGAVMCLERTDANIVKMNAISDILK